MTARYPPDLVGSSTSTSTALPVYVVDVTEPWSRPCSEGVTTRLVTFAFPEALGKIFGDFDRRRVFADILGHEHVTNDHPPGIVRVGRHQVRQIDG